MTPRSFQVLALTRRKDRLAYEDFQAIDDGKFLTVMIPHGVDSVTFSTGEAEKQPMRSVADYDREHREVESVGGDGEEPLYSLKKERGPDIDVMKESKSGNGKRAVLTVRCSTCLGHFTCPASLARSFCTAHCRKTHFHPATV